MKRKLPIKPNSVAVYVVRVAGGKTEMLLLKRQGAYLDGTWQQVVGGIKPDEAGHSAAWREFHEETGIQHATMYSADFIETYYDAEKDAIYMTPIFVAFVEASADVKLSREHSEYRWVNFDEALRLLPFAQQRDAVAIIRREFFERRPNELLRLKSE